MNQQSEANKSAWSYKAYEFWVQYNGLPQEAAADMMRQPRKYLRRHIEYLGDVDGKKVANLLGSNGRKAVPLALLGADVTVVDISEENKRYAMEVAEAAGVKLNYIVSDFFELDTEPLNNAFDILYLEGGILHYFVDLDIFAKKLYQLLKADGKLVLNDSHPFRKILKKRDIFDKSPDCIVLEGDYFDSSLQPGEVAYKKFFHNGEQYEFPECLLRYWTMGEIITAIASAGFTLEKLVEGPRFDEHKNLPGEFTLVALKK